MPALLALPAPADPLARYVAIREAQLQNPHLTLTHPWGLLRKCFLYKRPSWVLLQVERANEERRQMDARVFRRVQRIARRHQAKWPPLAGVARFPSHALSIRQPWAWLIVHGPKRFENRMWSKLNPARHFRGPFLIHAAQGMTRDEYAMAHGMAEENGVILPPFEELQRGGIIGEAHAANFVEFSEVDPGDAPWAFTSGIELINVKAIPFKPCKGRLGFFKVNYDEL
ncbi:hypothetical protein GCM10023213_14350 [Prosthecobacter algae]|uniref:ASCH domain-containing protein n=1 Tax=Prosthecobacter algae TaxID=1144682 RepID=A0ABP9P5E8_9BACT